MSHATSLLLRERRKGKREKGGQEADQLNSCAKVVARHSDNHTPPLLPASFYFPDHQLRKQV
jgi:hypothetical protein